MPTVPIYQVDAFTQRVFGGNPAAVCPLEAWLDDRLLQSIAAENNLAETAFFVPHEDRYQLRWFTPLHEVPLCGHATLASAFVIFTRLDPQRERVTFDTQSGPLHVTRAGERLTLDFPRRNPAPCDPPAALLEGLGSPPVQTLSTDRDSNYYAVYASEADVRRIQPRMDILMQLAPHGVAVTAPGDEVDFVSRYFAPSHGVPEDAVTGSTHCALAPYWAGRLGKTRLDARQLSPRQGELFCETLAERVLISGYAAAYLEGAIRV